MSDDDDDDGGAGPCALSYSRAGHRFLSFVPSGLVLAGGARPHQQSHAAVLGSTEEEQNDLNTLHSCSQSDVVPTPLIKFKKKAKGSV